MKKFNSSVHRKLKSCLAHKIEKKTLEIFLMGFIINSSSPFIKKIYLAGGHEACPSIHACHVQFFFFLQLLKRKLVNS